MKGFSLFELCISLFILSCMLLGTDMLLYRASYQSQSALYFHLATSQIHNITERLRIVKNQQGLAEQISQWNNQNKFLLPKGEGTIIGLFPIYKVNIYWGGRKKPCQENRKGLSGCITTMLVL